MRDLHIYLIRPGAPLVFRSGKPFGAGSRDGGNFPWPSALAGALRTAWWDARNGGKTAEELAALRELRVAGPLLASISNNGVTPLVPKPADAVYMKKEENINAATCIYRLRPKALGGNVGTNLPTGLLPMQMQDEIKGKPQSGPQFWTLKQLLDWQQDIISSSSTIDDLAKQGGHAGLDIATRTHLAIDKSTRAAEEGKLFQSEGLVFGRGHRQPHEYGILAGFAEPLHSGPITLGGERRLSWLEKPGDAPLRPEQSHLAKLATSSGLVLHLLTPALFDHGWKPNWLNSHFEGSPPGLEGRLTLKLVAVCSERWQAFSGWDLEQGGPRASRKLVPSGSSYWFEILNNEQNAAAELWLASISDQSQDQRNGFGLVIPGPYNFQGESQ